MNEAELQVYVGKTIKVIEVDPFCNTMFIQFTDDCSLYLDPYEDDGMGIIDIGGSTVPTSHDLD